jgi:hypothetical protein
MSWYKTCPSPFLIVVARRNCDPALRHWRTPMCDTNGGGMMKRFLFALSSTAALVAVILVVSPATYADSPEAECVADGGTYVAAGPESSCTFAGEPVGNSDNTKGGSVDSGPGKSGPNETVTTCTGVNNKPHTCP